MLRRKLFCRTAPLGIGGAIALGWLLCHPAVTTPSYGQARLAAVRPRKAGGQHPLVIYTPPLSDSDRAVFAALHRKHTVRFSNTPLPRVIDTLSKLMGKEVVLDRAALAKDGIDPKLPISAEHKDVPLETALGDMFAESGLDYMVRKGRLEITTANKCFLNLVTRTYPVADLCPTDEAFEALKVEMYHMGGMESWSSMGGPAEISSDRQKRSFTIRQTQSNQEKILRLLITKRREARKKALKR